MDCKEARPLLDASADCELSAADDRRVQQHIDGCQACRREAGIVRAVSRNVRQANYHRASDALRARIVADLPPTSLPQRRRRWRFPLFGGARGLGGGIFGAPAGDTVGAGWLATLLIALCAVVAGVTLTLRRPADAGPLVDELVASHVRAQLSGREIDVVSSDQHTVKPWFNGRLDYAPPVEDLAASGFTLVGGRLDYVGHRRVAVLTYHYRKHVLDVYVFPETDPGAESPASTVVRDGYSLARWRDDGMVWWAITDAAPDSLAAFKVALNARLHGGARGEMPG
ncbi:anti-sigma factor [Paraburkholderia sp. BL10I2N1]|uniref:anti-sigma factor family protein n=1 Tax=Paraburkholderia sp. BL10I2N1 TaxID=1938796 RepID=UPI00105D1ABE|nr:anti-sigma factor [Paraburkholderia sp. BL10I2N1]TDN70341.1 anti-sigma factor RsiW [Paraburkholderia sp. BL10I2N1]